MTFEEAKVYAEAARQEWEKAKTRDEAAAIIGTYGKKIGYKPIVKILVLGQPVGEALKAYIKEE